MDSILRQTSLNNLPSRLFRLGSKRTYDQMSGRQDASTSTSDSNTTSASASSSGTSARPPSPSGSPPRQRRRVGDGLDMRRPATTQPPREYIDLTQDDSSPPPATRLSAGTTGTNHIRQAIPVQQAPNAPEIVDVDELPDVIDLEALDNESPPHDHIPFHDLRAAHHDRHAVQHQMQLLRRTGFQGFAQDDDADYGVSHFAIPRSQVPHRHVPRERIAQHMMHALGHRILDGIPAARRREVIWDRLPMLDYDAVPFHLNGEAGPSAAPEPPVPTYDAPSAPQEGYSRNPAEDEVAICPNCNEELATGESELKRQMWVVKGCGHVYCGDCADNRNVKRNAGKKAQPKAFVKCVVDGCGTRIKGSTAMIQLYNSV